MLPYVEIALSAIAIVVFAVERFSIPPSDPAGGEAPYRISRSTTTAAAYYTAVSLYGLIALGVFAFLLLSPQALDRLVATSPDLANSVPPWARQSPPLLLALILTVLLPKIPVLSNMDEWFRSRLQRIAAIPHEVRRLSAVLRRAPFRVEVERREEFVKAMIDKGFEQTDVRLDEGSDPYALWTKLAVLMQELDGWEADPRFISYVLTYPTEFNTLRLRYEALLSRARKCFVLLREQATDPDSIKKAGAVYAYRDDFVEEVEALLKQVYEAISNAVLLCELTERARVSQLIKLGFGLDPRPPRRLTLNELLGLFTGMSVVYAFGFVVIRQVREPQLRLGLDLLVLAFMIAAIYCVAVWCAIYPKTRWSFARLQAGQGRPWGWYLLSGIIGAAAGTLISYAVKVATTHADLGIAWELNRQTWPWTIMTFATTYGLAFLADDEPRDGFPGLLRADRLRWIEGVALTAVMAATAWLVHNLLLATHEAALARGAVKVLPVRPLDEMEILTVLIGFAIGYLVPSWYREAPVERHAEGQVGGEAGVTIIRP